MLRKVALIAMAFAVFGCVGGKGVDPKNDPDNVSVPADPSVASHIKGLNKTPPPQPKSAPPLPTLAERIAPLAAHSDLFKLIARCPISKSSKDLEATFGKPDNINHKGVQKDTIWRYDHLLKDHTAEVHLSPKNLVTSLNVFRAKQCAFDPPPSLQCGGDTDCINTKLKMPNMAEDVQKQFGDPTQCDVSERSWAWVYYDPRLPMKGLICKIGPDGHCNGSTYLNGYQEALEAAKDDSKQMAELKRVVAKYQAGVDLNVEMKKYLPDK